MLLDREGSLLMLGLGLFRKSGSGSGAGPAFPPVPLGYISLCLKTRKGRHAWQGYTPIGRCCSCPLLLYPLIFPVVGGVLAELAGVCRLDMLFKHQKVDWGPSGLKVVGTICNRAFTDLGRLSGLATKMLIPFLGDVHCFQLLRLNQKPMMIGAKSEFRRASESGGRQNSDRPGYR